MPFSSPPTRRPAYLKSSSFRPSSSTPLASFRRSSSLGDREQRHGENRTKSWTDQRAPEPFSSPPAKQRQQPTPGGKKKHGYGDLLRRSSSGGFADGASGPGIGGSHSFHSSRPGIGTSLPLHRRDEDAFANGYARRHAGHAAVRRGSCDIGRTTMASSAASRPTFGRQPSFAKSEFPLLSPARPKKPSFQERKASWSAMVGGNRRDVTVEAAAAVTASTTTTTTASSNADSVSFGPIAGISPPPLCGEPSPEKAGANDGYGERSEEPKVFVGSEVPVADYGYIDAEVETSSSHGDSVAEPVPSLPKQSSWMERRHFPQRLRSHSFHHNPPHRVGSDNTLSSSSFSLRPLSRDEELRWQPSNEDSYHPFSTFTTMSIAALQNDIGTLLARSNRTKEAKKRYKLSIASAELALEELQHQNTSNKLRNKEGTEGAGRWRTCPWVTEAEGLAWFRQKLLRGDVLPAAFPPAGDGDRTQGYEDVPSEPRRENVPFQPAGFGGRAPPTPRRMRSASFGVADLHPPSRQLSMPSDGIAESIDEAPSARKTQPNGAPISPILRLTNLSARMASFPVTALHPGKQSLQISRSHSACAAAGAPSARHRRATIQHSVVHPPLDDIVHDIHQHQKLDCPDEVYSCNGLTPLGMEYVCDPLPVLGGSLRRLVASGRIDKVGGGGTGGVFGFDSDGLTKCGRGEKRQATSMIESAALIAARINLASLEYRVAGGGKSEKLQEVLSILESASKDCNVAFEIAESLESSCEEKFSSVFGLLKAVVHSNIGTVKYRLKKVRESITSFEVAISALEDDGDDRPIEFHHNSETYDDSRFPPRAYLLLVVRLNLSRVSLRLNQPEDAEKYCALISEDNKLHERNSTRLRNVGSLQQKGGVYRGFDRSNSFSAASSALEASIAAYEHDIDRRSKWLSSVAEHFVAGLILESKGEASDYREALHHYNRLLSLARTKLDHRHAYVCAILERRGAVLFEQRKLPSSMLSYLACLNILEHQESAGSSAFNRASLSRVLYAVARVLHDREEYHDALYMYQRALACQRALAAEAGRPSLDVITTLCNISRVHHLSGEIDASLVANREVLDLATALVGGRTGHPFLIHRLKVEGNILVEAGRLEDAMRTFVEAARRCSEDGQDRMMATMMGGGAVGGGQEDADAGDSSVLSIRSAAALAQITCIHPAASAA